MDIETSRLILHAVDEFEARRILARAPGPGDAWAADYPFAGDIAAIDSFLRATEQHASSDPSGTTRSFARPTGWLLAEPDSKDHQMTEALKLATA